MSLFRQTPSSLFLRLGLFSASLFFFGAWLLVAGIGGCQREDIELDPLWPPDAASPTCQEDTQALSFEGTAMPSTPAVLLGQAPQGEGSLIQIRAPAGWKVQPTEVSPDTQGRWAALLSPLSTSAPQGWVEVVQNGRCLRIQAPPVRISPSRRPLSPLSLPVCQEGKDSLLRFEAGSVFEERDISAMTSQPSLAFVRQKTATKDRATTTVTITLACVKKGRFSLLVFGSKIEPLLLALNVD